jgi:hypothetical protein
MMRCASCSPCGFTLGVSERLAPTESRKEPCQANLRRNACFEPSLDRLASDDNGGGCKPKQCSGIGGPGLDACPLARRDRRLVASWLRWWYASVEVSDCTLGELILSTPQTCNGFLVPPVHCKLTL